MLSLKAEQPGWVAQAAVLELVWVMTSVFRFDRKGMTQILEDLLSREELVFEQAGAVRAALRLYRIGKADFPDCLISSCAHAAGCEAVLTFDRRAARDAGMELAG